MLKNQINRNDLRLTVLEKQAQKYRQFLESIKTKQNNNQKEMYQINEDFLKTKKEESIKTFNVDYKKYLDSIQETRDKTVENKDNKTEKKVSFISSRIEALKNSDLNINTKINTVQDPKTDKETKEELFKSLTSEIAEFESMIQTLKEENKLLRQELELLVEKDKKEKEKNTLEKEQKDLKSKIQTMKEKTKNSIEQSEIKEVKKEPTKINKITNKDNERER